MRGMGAWGRRVHWALRIACDCVLAAGWRWTFGDVRRAMMDYDFNVVCQR